MLPLRRACQTVGYACLVKIYLASLGKHRNSLQSRLRSRILFFACIYKRQKSCSNTIFLEQLILLYSLCCKTRFKEMALQCNPSLTGSHFFSINMHSKISGGRGGFR